MKGPFRYINEEFTYFDAADSRIKFINVIRAISVIGLIAWGCFLFVLLGLFGPNTTTINEIPILVHIFFSFCTAGLIALPYRHFIHSRFWVTLFIICNCIIIVHPFAVDFVLGFFSSYTSKETIFNDINAILIYLGITLLPSVTLGVFWFYNKRINKL